ncbi:MAG TPA: CHRD domain-containing protein [Actinomycetota bacterium]|nr:CHRD domain-containing protein [Actinomycetota bacterium]
MGRRLAAVAAIVFAVLIPAGAVGADAGRPFATTLTGAAEVPPADPDASGTASIILNQGLGTVCFDVSWENVDGTVFASHIHFAPAGMNGPIVVPLFAGSFAGTDSASGCVDDVDRDLIKAIRQDPSAYYVNVHSTPNFPGGAIRGQLSK